jgi:hypothetical protein
VVATDNYAYGYTYQLQSQPAAQPDPARVMRMITHDFSRYFSFTGCGSVIKVGQSCTLSTWEDRIPQGPIKVVGMTATSFSFLSQPWHPEGQDRRITFSIVKGAGGRLSLKVDAQGPWSPGAYITDHLGIVHFIWQYFADRLTEGLARGDWRRY